MALDFNRPAASGSAAEPTAVPAVQEETYQKYDIVADRQQMNQQLTNSPEVDRLASQIEVYNLETISPSALRRRRRSPSAPTWS